MTLIQTTTTSKFFGEPVYLGEVLKDLISQALRLDRSTLKFKHQRTDEADAPAIHVMVDTLGDDAISEQLIAALNDQFINGSMRNKLQIVITFAGQMENGLFTPQESLSVPTNEVVATAHFDSPSSEFHSYEDMMGEIGEQRRWYFSR